MLKHADQACSACKKLKRRCDKILPQCGLCARTRRSCEYSTLLGPAPTAEDLAAIENRIARVEHRLESTSSSNSVYFQIPSAKGRAQRTEEPFPSALFLDFDCYKWAQMRVPKPKTEIPVEVLATLTQGNTIVEIAEKYFDTIHTWMPVISKKRMMLGIAMHDSGGDLAMLFLAMRLVVSAPDTEEAHAIYKSSREFLMQLEIAGMLSHFYLQAMLLVGLYEYGQAMYPAAWMTAGACMRYANMLGLSCSRLAIETLGNITTWTEAEERRRLWWGIFILDRLSCLGSQRDVGFPDPPEAGALPVDDSAWAEGSVKNAHAYPVSTDLETYRSPFADLCRVCMLVGTVLRHAGERPQDVSYHLRTAELITTLCTMNRLLDKDINSATERITIVQQLGSRALVKSALFALCDKYVCPEHMSPEVGYRITEGAKCTEEIELQSRCVDLVQDLSVQAQQLCAESISPGHEDVDSDPYGRVSPFSLDVCYSTLTTLHWLHGESGHMRYRASISELEKYLEIVGSRWRRSRECLSLSRRYDVAQRLESV